MTTATAQTRLGSSLPERIGNTPLIRLEQPVRGLEGMILLAKASNSGMDMIAPAMQRVIDSGVKPVCTPGAWSLWLGIFCCCTNWMRSSPP